MAKRAKTYSALLSIGKPSKISTDRWVLIICICSFIWIVFYKLIFVHRQELFLKASAWGEITFNLLTSVIASAIFYFFVVYLERKNTKRVIYPVLKKKLLDISVSVPFIMSALEQATKSGIHYLPGEETFTKLYGEIKFKDKPPKLLGHNYQFESWNEFFLNQFQAIRFHSELLYKYGAFLSPQLLLRLSNFQYSDFESSLANTNDTYPDFSIRNSGLWNFLHDLQELTGRDLKTLE